MVQFVKSTIPAECSGFTAKDTTAAGTTDKNDSDADKTTGITAKVTLDPKALSATSTAADSLATNNLTVDAGLLAPLGSIGDYVWKDANRNGKQDSGETGVNGVQVILWSATTTGTPVAKLDSATTAGAGANAGKYLFSNLPKGDYVVQFVKSTIPAECSGFTAKDTTAVGTTDKNDSDADKTTGITAKVTLDPKVLSGTSTPADSLATNNLTVDAGLVAPLGSLGDFVWKDTNNNGIQDETTPNGGGVAGVQVELYKVGTATAIAKDTTDATGKYLFSNLDAGTYKIKVLSASIPAGCEISSVKDAPSDDAKDSDVDKTTGESGNYVIDPTDPTKKDILTVDAALYSPKGSLGDFVWKDTNNNGIQDETTPNGGGVAGVQIELYKVGTTAAIAKDTTDATGKYLFSNLDAGTYKIKVLSASIPAGCEISSVKDAPSDDAKDSDVDKTTGFSGDYVIDPTDPTKKDILTVDAALYSPKGSLGDFVWKDTNNNGIQDETTPNGGGVAGVQIELYKVGTTAAIAKDTTDATGKYLFSNLDAGTYKIKVLSASIPAGCEISSVKDAPSDDAKDSDVDKTTGESGNYVIDPTDPTKKDILTVDAALYSPKGSLGDFVWKDTNNNGIQDETTPNGGGVAGVQIELYKNGTLFAKDTTDATGHYLFPNLDAGTYKIKVLSASIPAGCEISSVKDAPSDDAKDSDVDKTTGESGNYVIDPLDPTKKDILTVDAALYSPKGSLGDFVWKDTNNNGIQDETTPNGGGVAGVQIELYKNGTLFTKDTTDATGKYLFSNLDAGTYKIKVLSASIPAGCEISAVKDAPSDDAKDSDVDKTTGESGNYVIDPLDPTKKDILTVDAALFTPKGSLGDFVWKDTNNNGIQDETTPNGGGVAGVQIELYKNGTLFAKDTTDATGKYLFSNLDAGTYKIKVLSASIPAGCEISAVKDAPSDDAKDSDVDKTTGESGNYVIDPLDPTKKDILTVDAALAVPCVKSTVTLTGAPVCSADVQTYSLTFSVTNKVGIIKVDKGTLTGSNPYTVTGIPSGATVKITDSLSAVCKWDTLITGPNCNCNPPLPTLVTPSLTACIGDTFPTIKATIVGLATVEWFATATSTEVLFTGLNYKPAGNVTAAGATFYAQARSTDPSCPAAISTSRVMATINAQNCTVEVDLALKKSINTKIAQIGDELTYTLKVYNQSATGATGVEVVDSIATTVQFVAGSFTASRGTATITDNVIKWTIGNIASGGDTVTLTYRIKATQEGVHFNTAEICKTNEKDIDSTPCNHDEDEDDIDRQCFTVPIKLCAGEKVQASVPANLTNVQWFKNGSSTPTGNGNVILLTEVGTYTFTATNQTCPVGGCCPVIIEAGANCCPVEVCIPFTVKKRKK